MKKLTFLMALLPILFCACSSFHEENSTLVIPTTPDLQAGFAEDTRTYVENNKYLRWHEDDRLSAFWGNTLNRQYKFNGETGDNSGTFSLVPSGELGTGNIFDHIYAVYPYNEGAKITDEGVISLTLPATQLYAEDSFGKGANTMIAVTESVDDTFLAFKNACGYLKLKLYNAKGVTIKSITLEGNNSEKIAGAATATIKFGEAPVLNMADNATTSITLDCGGGVKLGTTDETAATFWIALPETTFKKGITIVVTDTENGVFEKSTLNSVAIKRNTIQPMAALDVEYKETTPETWKIYYTSSQGVVVPNANDFGANIVSNEWSEISGIGVITFDGEVTKIGNSAFRARSQLKSITIPDSVTLIGNSAFGSCEYLENINIPNSVTKIGNDAFEFCGWLQNITIPGSVISIGSCAFESCSSLTRVIIENGVTEIGAFAFSSSGLTSITIPDSVTEIGERAFECSKLTNVTIGNGVTEIRNETFGNCSKLRNVNIPNSLTSLGEYAFYGCSALTSITLGNSISKIGARAFYASGLTSITIPDSVTEIGEGAFYNCTSLTGFYGKFSSSDNRCLVIDGVLKHTAIHGLAEYTIPNSVTSIGELAFYGYTSLISVIISDSVTEIGIDAFNRCTSLARVILPHSINKIGVRAFASCKSLTSVTIPNSVTSIGDSAFSYCKSLTTITIGESVTSIGEQAFKSSGLISVTIPDSVTSIGEQAFYDCSSLKSVTIGNSVTEIGGSTFENCLSLTSVTIPDSVTEIGASAFYNCTSLKEVYCKATTPPAGGSNMFYSNASGRKIYVPAESVEAYKSATYWKKYASYIEGYEF
ncbi:MAG: leucine-rich repeat domain-containing protein [Alistipes sp.]|nr:leucine-rich repeat domain-containing protein [Alistipes sp.]